MDTIRKDWLALSAAMFLGALFARSLGYSIGLGVLAGLIGGVLGYIFCLFTEPKHIWLATREAWRKTTEWCLKPDWRSRLASGADFGLTIGGLFGIIVGVIAITGESNDAQTSFELTMSYLFWSFLTSLLVIVFCMIIQYSEEKQYDSDDSFVWGARNLNIIYLHLHAVRLILIAVNYLFFGLILLAMHISESTPAVICGIPRFAKNFAILVHSEKATAFGVYGSIGATAIYFLVPYSPVLMAIIAAIGGGIGVYARPLALDWLQRA
ncbi:MAG: hypothetical protein Q8Q46_02335 [Candidatus Giovannonibacteria bacterium]|nr:hypothetical protein [Candidatus Giovannonibacteria bacterium]